MLKKTFVLCNKEKESDRYNNLLKEFNKVNLNHEYFTYIWKDEINNEIRNKYTKTDYSMAFHGRSMKNKPLTNGEISLVLNYIECLKYIKNNYNDGLFLIVESDIFFKTDFSVNLNKILQSIKDLDTWDIINVGQGANQIPTGRKQLLNNIEFYKEPINRFAEGIIWNYNSICKFLDYFMKNEDINGPIDTIMDVYSEHIKNFNIYWTIPSIIYQGSWCGNFPTSLR